MVPIIFLVIAVVVLLRLSLPLLVALCAAIYIKPDWFFACLDKVGINNTENGRRFMSAIRPYLPGIAVKNSLPEANSVEKVSPSVRAADSANRHKNISRVDEILIGLGIVGTMLGVLLVYGQLSSGTQLHSLTFIIALSALLVSISLLILGLIARRREKACLRLFSLMQHTSETQISVLTSQSHFTITTVRRAVNTINSAGIAYLILDEQSDRLYDGRLQARITLAHDCTNCGASTEITIDIQTEQDAVCSYCSTPFPVAAINALRLQRRQSVAEESQVSAGQFASRQLHILTAESAPKFSLGKFLLLIVFFWPGALFYVANYHMSNRAHASRLHALINQQSALTDLNRDNSLVDAHQ